MSGSISIFTRELDTKVAKIKYIILVYIFYNHEKENFLKSNPLPTNRAQGFERRLKVSNSPNL